MKLIVIPDIFGRTPALETICDTLSQTVSDITIIDPYDATLHRFETEAHAYAYFTDHVGLKKYQSIVTDRLTSLDPDIVLIGFSVGASAIWGLSHQGALKHIKKAFCFYGAQIRQKAHIHPVFDLELIFPEYEPHFNVDDLIERLHPKACVTCSKANGLHGFMNELSPHFDPACYTDYIRQLKRSLDQLRKQKPSKSPTSLL